MKGRIRTSDAWSEREEQVIHHLRSYRKLVMKHRTLVELLTLMQPSCVARITDGPKTSKPGNHAEMQLISSLEVQAQYKDNLAEIERSIDSIATLIRTLPEEEYTIIMRRYMLGQGMDAISEEVNYSVRRCWDIHSKGIRRLAESLHTAS